MAHEQFLPVYEKYWLVGIDAILVLLLEALLYVSVEYEFHIIGPFEALVEQFFSGFLDQEVVGSLQQFGLDGLEFVAAHAFKGLQVREVNVLPLELSETIDVGRLKEAIEHSGFHSQLFSQVVVAHREHGVA